MVDAFREAQPVRALQLETIQVGTRSNRCLQNPQDLKIGDCRKMKDLTWVAQLERLEQISVTKCNGIEEIACGGTARPGSSILFLKLKQMFVFNLPKLRSICPWPLPFPY
ncbi:hypothetical protein H6P81_020720 [Aristolochia fimbriata]|uniref:Uncharacterized protein n=1 Tax=Aristolochia fimbriata TaxID=158543 RepID=A0AAV7DV70_ARIFI|nr:hypothetical protein H6P81_020720 [Aristolochia fimbriata]